MDRKDASAVGSTELPELSSVRALSSLQPSAALSTGCSIERLLKYHYFTDTHIVPLAGEDSVTAVEWSQIKGSGVKFLKLEEKQ